ncbi:MAG: hypothetical protein WC708_15230 [Lentisphaeria bacterium]
MKTWLNNNKIYFETVASFLLSIMAILVGWAQYNVGTLGQATKKYQLGTAPPRDRGWPCYFSGVQGPAGFH